MDFNQLVEQQTLGMPFGQVQFTVKVHRGQVSRADAVKNTNVKIQGNNPDADAAAIIISAMKAHPASLGDSSLGFVVMYRHGKPSVVQVQEFITQGV